MRILHVSLGLPPLRSGGLVRYCCDLMGAQINSGDDVYLLYPAGYAKRPRVDFCNQNGVKSFGFYSPNIIPLSFGVSEPDKLDLKNDFDIYNLVLDSASPDVVHIHSIQGIGFAFFDLLNKRDIKSVFTTHDYYPICLKCTFIDWKGASCNTPCPTKCATCNVVSGLDSRKNRIMQSQIYSNLKGMKSFAKIRSIAKGRMERVSPSPDLTIQEDVAKQYERALSHNRDIISKVSLIHANSELAKSVYTRNFPGNKVKTLPITHSNLPVSICHSDNDGIFTIGYVGGKNEIKGYRTLLKALSYLPASFNWRLLFYGTHLDENEIDPDILNKIQSKGFYKEEESSEVFSQFDVLVVPSIWQETFCFAVLEGLSAGVTVLCSDLVGAKDLVSDRQIFTAGNAHELAKLIIEAGEAGGNQNKLPLASVPTMADHAELVKRQLYCIS